MNKLRNMAIFASIVEQGSISAAAEHLNLSKSVLSQHLKALEADLGLTLLKRTTRRQSLTQAGEQFYQQCKSLNEIATSAWQQLEPLKTTPQGKIKITASHALMDTLVVPAIGKLLKQYPKLQPELLSEDQHLDFMEHNIDLAIRVGSSENSAYKQKRLGQFRDILCGSPALAKEQNIEQLPYIANHWQGQHIKHQFKNNKGDIWHYQTKPSCVTNSFHSCLSLITSGVGIGLVPSFYFEHSDIELVNLRPEMQLAENKIYALHPYQNNQPVNVKICTEAITQELIQRQQI